MCLDLVMKTMTDSKCKIYFVLGEESGDALGADLYPALISQGKSVDREVEIIGLAGTRLSKLGVHSLFDIEEIAVMGASAVVARLPKIIRRISETVADIVEKNPDAVLLIDSPGFTHAVAKRVRKKLPNVQIINYVCPSVWAWRSGRAKKMCAYINHVLTILPFEVDVLSELNGPNATYVGHPLARQIASLPKRKVKSSKSLPLLLVLPGSRMSELKRMLPKFRETLKIMQERGVEFRAVIPAVPHLKKSISAQVVDWPVNVEVTDSADNDVIFPTARAALATSGTVTLQLALHKVPMVTGYIFDPMAKPFLFLVTIWSALLPNLIADRPFVPEKINQTVVPGNLARTLERLLIDSPERQVQMEGFDDVIKAMKTQRPPRDLAAEVIFEHIN